MRPQAGMLQRGRFLICSAALSLAVLFSHAVCSFAGDIPSSSRSRTAISRVRPSLEAELSGRGMEYGSGIYLRIFKKSRELELWIEKGGTFELFRTYPVCSYSGKLGPKVKTGDRQSPEGFYHIRPKSMNPYSRFHLSLNIGYPNAYDRAHGRTGSALMVHGNCVSIGCYATTDRKTEEIYALADAALGGGQEFFRVHIFPFRMAEGNMNKYEKSKWYTFWENLSEGYDNFEKEKRPPDVTVRGKKYHFGLS
ncbi:L,D-transpeptidase family protein [Candidatus Moduliflexota bacterium]